MTVEVPPKSPRRLSDFIAERAATILSEWSAAVRVLRPAGALSESVLLDDLPKFLDNLARYVGAVRTDSTVTADVDVPVIHAIDRLDVGYDLRDVVEEYAILREVIVTMFVRENAAALRSAEMPRMHRALDTAVRIAVERFAAARDRTIIALDRLSTAFIGNEEPDVFLPETVRLLCESIAAVDSAGIFVRENDLLVLRAASGQEISGRIGRSVRVGECFAGRVAQVGKPVSIRDATHDPIVTTDLAPREGTRALYGAPMGTAGELIGVAFIASRTTNEFSHEDQVLFRATVARVNSLLAKARLRLREREQRLLNETLVRAQDALGEGVTVQEASRTLFANDAFSRLTGYSNAELMQFSSLFELLVPEALDEFRERIAERPISGEFVDRYRAPILQKNGTRVLLDVAATRIGSKTVIVSRDVTREEQADRLLRESEDRLRLATDASGLGTWERRPDGSAIQWDARAKVIHGLAVDRDVTNEDVMALTHPHDRDRLEDAFSRVLRPDSDGELSIDYRIVRANDGEVRWIFRKGRVFFDERGRPQRVLGTFADVTEGREQHEQLETAVEFRDRMLAILGHDLRNPLSAIRIAAELLRKQSSDSKARGTIDRVEKAVSRIDSMVRDILDFAQSRFRGSLAVVRSDIDLDAVVRQVADEFSLANPGRIQLDLCGCTRGSWDGNRLAQMLSNLVGNAIQYGSVESPIIIATRSADAGVLVSVHNRGEPIAADTMAILFEPFRRGQESGRSRNLGLGLYIAQQIAVAHGGRIDVTSTADEGTSFAVFLPA